MSLDAQNSAELHKLCGKLRDQEITEAEAERLNALLVASKDARRFYRTFIALASALETRSATQDSDAEEQNSDQYLDDLLELLHMEQSAQALAELPKPAGDPVVAEQTEKQSLTWSEIAGASSYLLGQAARSRPAMKLAVAAALALAATLVIVLIIGNDEPGESTVRQDSATQMPGVTPLTVVAAITAEYEAVWDRRPGQDLYAGQRLTLTQGFAEVTTARGAVAIIEAPTTIELLDNDNALRLHAGKLVGICETASSKGFIVRAPHMDVTDLGTRFGVDADADGTVVKVFEGEVEVAHRDAKDGAEPTRLLTDQAASASSVHSEVTRVNLDADRFAELMPTLIPLQATGQGLAVGDIDPMWKIVAIDGKPLASPQAVRVNGIANYVLHFPNDPASSQFIAWPSPVDPPEGGSTTYTFRTHIDIPETMNPDGARLVMKYMADNALDSVVVNGRHIDIQNKTDMKEFNRWARSDVKGPFVRGRNTIDMVVRNQWSPDTQFNLVGMRLVWRLEGWTAGLGNLGDLD